MRAGPAPRRPQGSTCFPAVQLLWEPTFLWIPFPSSNTGLPVCLDRYLLAHTSALTLTPLLPSEKDSVFTLQIIQGIVPSEGISFRKVLLPGG